MALRVFEIRAHERAMTLSASLTMACLGAAASVIASAADALFLTHVGPAQFGLALAISSVTLVMTLSWVGARADRAAGRGRGALLQPACALAALVALGLSLTVGLDAVVGAWLALLLGKQLTSSVDLLFWVLAARQLDARQNRRLVPMFVTAHGLGTVAGAFSVGPLAHALGSRAALAVGGLLFLAAAACTRRFAHHRGARSVAVDTGRKPLTEQSALAVVKRSRLTRHLALVVAAAGLFAPLLYVLMGTAARAELAADAALTTFFGQYRGAVQLLTFVAQLLIAPRLFARAGVAVSLLLAPAGALAGALALGAAHTLAVVVAAQALVKLLDAAIQTPAEKLAQNLLPRRVRGRVAGFLDGVAKRVGAVAGGVCASVLSGEPVAMVAALVVAAAMWLAASARMYRHFADMAVAELERAHRAGDRIPFGDELDGPLADSRTVDRLRTALLQPERQELAIELMVQLAGEPTRNDEHRVDIRAELAAAAARGEQPERLLLALFEQLQTAADHPVAWPHVIDCLFDCLRPERVADADRAGERDAWPAARVLAVRALGLAVAQFSAIGDDRRARVVDHLRATGEHGGDSGHALAMQVAEMRARADDPREHVLAALDEGDAHERAVAFDELTVELALELAVSPSVHGRASRDNAAGDSADAALEHLLAHTWALLRTLRRRARAHPDDGCARAGLTIERVVARCEGAAHSSAEVLLLRSQTYELAQSWLSPDSPASLFLAGVRLLARMARPEDASFLANALGHADAQVRAAAVPGLARLGPAALDPLLAASRYGRRSARAAASAVLRALRLSTEALESAIADELTVIDRYTVQLSAFAALERAELLCLRLAERIHEATHGLFAMLAARIDIAGVAMIGAHFTSSGPRSYLDESADDDQQERQSANRASRAHALETLDTLLPRELAGRVTAVLEGGPLAVRARRARARLGEQHDRDPDAALDRAVRAALALGDPLTSALVVEALDRAERAHHRDDIFAAASEYAQSADPIAMLQRLTAGLDPDVGDDDPDVGDDDDADKDKDEDEDDPGAQRADPFEEDDMPRLVESVMQLHRVPLFSELTTRQLGELADVVRWRSVRPDEVVVEQGQMGDAMYFVVSGHMRVTVGHGSVSTLGPGEPFGEMALFEELPRSATVSAIERSRIGRISRTDFESLVEDMPSIALAICRVLSRRVRAHNAAASSRSPKPSVSG